VTKYFFFGKLLILCHDAAYWRAHFTVAYRRARHESESRRRSPTSFAAVSLQYASIMDCSCYSARRTFQILRVHRD